MDHPALTDRELDVYRLLGEGASVDEVALRLGVARSTVAVYIERLKTKLAVDSIQQIAVRAVHDAYAGCCLPPLDPPGSSK